MQGIVSSSCKKTLGVLLVVSIIITINLLNSNENTVIVNASPLIMMKQQLFPKVASDDNYIKPGVDNYLQPLFGHSIGLVTNPSGQSYGLTKSTVDLLLELSNAGKLKLVALFAPEHGVYGDKPPGEYFGDYTDPVTKLPVYSLYNNKHPQNELYKPLPYMLTNITMLVLDIQDVGMRPFTFISTMCETLISAKENNLKFTVLDRVDYLNGNIIGGPVLNLEYKSFIGIYKIPIITGMTMGELALLFDTEMNVNLNRDLAIIPVKDDSFNTYAKFRPSFRQIRLEFHQPILYLPPSPNLPTIDTVELYSGLVLFEAFYNVSLGRGTTNPFSVIGSPFIDSRKWVQLLETEYATELALYFKYVQLSYPTYFIPSQDIHVNKQCEGVRLILKPVSSKTNDEIEEYYRNFLPISLTLIKSLLKMYGYDKLMFRDSFAHVLFGSQLFITQLLDGNVTVAEMVKSWQPDLDAFNTIRSKYLIYKK